MRMRALLLTGLLITASLATAQLAEAPVHGNSRWYTVVMPAGAQAGQAIPVRSLATNEVIGGVLADTRFLAFGTDGRILTMAFNGTIGYVPVEAAQELHPRTPVDNTFRMYGKTLEQQANEYDERMKTAANVSLAPLDKEPKTANPMGAAGIPGGLQGYMGNSPQPGAALYGGGLPGVQQMVQPQMQPFGATVPGGSLR